MLQRSTLLFMRGLILSGLLIMAVGLPEDSTTAIAENKLDSCDGEGLHPDYESNCQTYLDCRDGEVKARHSCQAGFAFSNAAGQCVPASQAPCVRHECSVGDTSAYASPATKCSQFYHCAGAEAHEEACAPGAWFDFERQACRRGPGVCREPVCAGRRDGPHADTTHGCRRALLCKESKLWGVLSCPVGELFGEKGCAPADRVTCDHPKKDSIRHAVGDDEAAQDCREKADGLYPDFSTSCSQYFYCSAGQRTFKKYCESGKVFNGKSCVYKSLFYCPNDPRNPCVGKNDGFHRDSKDCQSFYYCEGGRTTYSDSCPDNLIWNGKTCVSDDNLTCLGPLLDAPECKGKPKGVYQDRSLTTLCKRYYHCDAGTKLEFECPHGTIFDGEQCVSNEIYTCPSLEPDSCDFKTDGYYKQTTGGCRGYYLCSKNSKIVYVCDDNFVFNGKKCVPFDQYKCPYATFDCQNKSNGYHKDTRSGCRKYYFCENGEKVTTFQCPGIKVYDGRTCVNADNFECPVSYNGNLCAFKNNGYYVHYGTGCRSYYRCTDRKVSSYHTCDAGEQFDGVESCVAKVATSDNCKSDGFFADFSSRCRFYYSCIDGKKTLIECPSNKVFNGDVCVPEHSYTCIEECLR